MDEIKFRAWDKQLSQMFTVDKMWKENGEWMVSAGTFEIRDYVIMQYTGLKDKNGKNIYDGDIVYHHDNNYRIEWDICRYKLVNTETRRKQTLHPHPTTFEVIGNIYEEICKIPVIGKIVADNKLGNKIIYKKPLTNIK